MGRNPKIKIISLLEQANKKGGGGVDGVNWA